METYALPSGNIIVCNSEEARSLWQDSPDKRHEIWSEEEFDACLLADHETVESVMAWKRGKPGNYLVDIKSL